LIMQNLNFLMPFFCTGILFVNVEILQDKMELEVEAYLRRRYEGEISDVEIIEKEDLDLVCALLCRFNSISCLTSIVRCYHGDQFGFIKVSNVFSRDFNILNLYYCSLDYPVVELFPLGYSNSRRNYLYTG
jgi:hypothetical protein